MDEPSLRKTQWYSLAIVIFAGDQAAKSYIDATTPLGWSHEVASFFNLVHALNPGAAFSFLAGAGGWQRWFFLAIAFAISAWLAWLLSRPLRKRKAFRTASFWAAHWATRSTRTRGHVIDYIDFTCTAGTGPPSTSLTWPSWAGRSRWWPVVHERGEPGRHKGVPVTLGRSGNSQCTRCRTPI